MNTTPAPVPRVTRIDIHYDDGSKDEIETVPKNRKNVTQIPSFIWSRSSSVSKFKHARTRDAVAAVLFQTALTRRLMDHEPRDKNTLGLLESFAHIWPDLDYPPLPPSGESAAPTGLD